MQDKTQEVINKFSDYIRETVLEHNEKVRVLNKEINNLKSRNSHLLKKLEIKYEGAEINDNELYLVGRIERLETELKQTEEYCKSLQKKLCVDK